MTHGLCLTVRAKPSIGFLCVCCFIALQVRALLSDPSWLEVKLHCYGVAAVVDDFRSYLQVWRGDTIRHILSYAHFRLHLASWPLWKLESGVLCQKHHPCSLPSAVVWQKS